MDGLSRHIAEHVADFDAADLPPATLHAAKRALLDGIGVMLAASGCAPEAEPFVEQARRAGAGPATVLGTDIKAPAGAAALANGAFAHAMDFEDAFDAAPSHPNASALPAVLATAQERGGVSGRELLTAIALGCDLVCRLGLSLRREMEAGGWYPPPILGAFGATAAAARARGLNAQQILDALSLVLCQISTPGEIKYDTDTVIRAVREAFPAQAAVQAVALAALGVRGFAAPLEGKAGFYRLFTEGQYAPSALLGDLGEHFWIEDLTFKRWPACRGTHGYIEAVQALRADFRNEDIVEIVATGGSVQRMLAEPLARKQAPATAIDAKFSIPFAIGAALREEEVTLDSFTDAALVKPETLRLASLVRYEARPDWGRDKAASAILSIRLKDGRELTHEVDVALGHPSRPLDDAALTAKFIDCAGRAARPMAEADARALADRIWLLESERDVASLL